MQLVQETAKVISNLDSEKKSFGVKDMGLVMQMLTKMYSNPINTLTQEYIANARDANREVRQTRKVEVTAPSRFAPVMIIKDFGPGLSPERIDSVFMYYGASTKRHTNNQNGGFGIGAKSAWAYTDSFTIISNYESVKRTYIAAKAGFEASLNLISETHTKEPNGTTIEIAINPVDVDKFKRAILRSVFFWSDAEKPLLKGFTSDEMKGNEPQIDFDKFKEIKIYKSLPNYITDFTSNNRDLVVIDGIPYPNRLEISKLRQLIRQNFVLFLNTGDVTMLPSREEFTKDDKATKFFDTLDKAVTQKLTDHINDSLKAMPTLKDGLKQFIELKNKFQFTGKYKNFHFDSYNIWLEDPALVKAGNYHTHLTLGNRWEYRGSKLNKQEFNQFSPNTIDNMYYDDMPNESAAKKVWRVRKTLDAGKSRFTLVKDSLKALADELDLKPLSSIDASDYTVQRTAKAATKKLEICVHFFNYKLETKQVTLANVNETIIYASHTQPDVYNHRNGKYRKAIAYINGMVGRRFAFIADTYESKIANNPNFIKFEDFIKTHKLTDKQVKWNLHLKGVDGDIALSHFAQLKDIVKDVNDPVIKYFVDLASFAPGNDVSTTEVPEEFMKADHPLIKEYEAMIKEYKTIPKKYPLFDLLASNLNYHTGKNKAFRLDVLAYINSK